jgi:hypothetical protein
MSLTTIEKWEKEKREEERRERLLQGEKFLYYQKEDGGYKGSWGLNLFFFYFYFSIFFLLHIKKSFKDKQC